MNDQDKKLELAHHELLFYTLEKAEHDLTFIHQLGVDAWAAQNATEYSKVITVAFALIGLYLHLERGFTGKQVQNAHIILAKKRKIWPSFKLPKDRGNLTVFEVLAAQPGQERDEMIEKWCASVWEAWRESHTEIANLIALEMKI